MNTCKSCKYWRSGQCDQINVDENSRRPKVAIGHAWRITVDVADDHNLEVALLTGPDFGCVHHAAKDALGGPT